MERFWPGEALDFEQAVEGALRRAGGIELTRRCEADPARRELELQPVLDALGLLDLDVGTGPAEAAAAALGMRAAGAAMCPWPLVERLVVPAEARDRLDAIYVADGPVRRAEHLDLAGRSGVLDIGTGELHRLEPTGTLSHMPLDPFGVPCQREELVDLPANGVLSRHLVLSAFWVLGALGRARDLAVEHARERHQFGRPISTFGAIQWHLSDIGVAHDGLLELAHFSLLRLAEDRLHRADALALHLTALESAHSVLTHAHQILAAMGLCEEHDLTVIDRHLQPVLRRQGGVGATATLLADEIGRAGFDAIFPIPPLGAPAVSGERSA